MKISVDITGIQCDHGETFLPIAGINVILFLRGAYSLEVKSQVRQIQRRLSCGVAAKRFTATGSMVKVGASKETTDSDQLLLIAVAELG